MKKKVLIITIVCVSLLVVALSCLFFFEHFFKLNGKSTEVVRVNSVYKEDGAKIYYRGKKYNAEVEGEVNTSKVGEYNVTYSTKDKKHHKKRKVVVIDDVKPNLVLSNETVDLEYGSEYQDEGFAAIDNYDGDLTSKVEVVNHVDKDLGNYYVEYTVSDSSGNTAKKIRNVIVKDTTKPEIKLNRKVNSYVIQGGEFNPKDFTAVDNYDGDVTDKVVVSGEVDTSKEGLYEVTYTVSDSNGNEEVLKTTVNVQPKASNVPVLMYHWFYDDVAGEKAGERNTHNFISKTNYESQLKYLKESNFYFPDWQELIDFIDGKIDLPKKSVILTDDDCVESFFRVAVPLNVQYDIPITSFCITKKDTWQSSVGIPVLDFESHTENMHERSCKGKWDGKVMCSKYDDIYNDIKVSVEKVCNKYAFAYPFGHYNDDTIKALKENGIQLAFTINDGRVKRKANKYKLPRVRISKGTSLSSYKKLVG